MKKNRIIALAVGALLLVTVAAAVVHLTGRIAPAEGALYIEKNGKSTEVVISDLVLEQVEIPAGVQATVTADDEYNATVTAEELAAPGKVYLMMQEEGGIQLVVFGDANSKRNVSNVKRVMVE